MITPLEGSNPALPKLAIFGAGGYIGKNFLHSLRSYLGQVDAYSSSFGSEESCSSLHQKVQGSLFDTPECKMIDVDIVFNFATAGVSHSPIPGIEAVASNIRISEAAARLTKASRGKLLIHMGSDKEARVHNGAKDLFSFSKNHDLSDQNNDFYALSKYIQTITLDHLTAAYEISAIIARLPNVYGSDDPPNSLIGQLKKSQHCGKTLELRQPETLLRFIHIKKLCPIILQIGLNTERLQKEFRCKIIPIQAPQMSVRTFVDTYISSKHEHGKIEQSFN